MSKRVDEKLSEAIVGDANEVAKMLSCDARTVLRDYEAGFLPSAMTVGGRTVWSLVEIKQWVEAKCPDRREWERLTNKGRVRRSRRKPARGGQPFLRRFDKFEIPTSGKSVFAWAKQMEDVFKTKVLAEIIERGQLEGCGRIFADWNEEQIRKICTPVISRLRRLPTYGGEFVHLIPDGDK